MSVTINLYATNSMYSDNIDSVNPGTLTIGAVNATKIDVASVGVSTEIQGNLNVVGNLSVDDNYIRMNNGYATAVAQDSGLVVNYLPTGTADTVSGNFVAGVAATSNPTVATTGAATFSVSDIVQISGSNNNDGIYEVLTHAANLITIRGVGTTAVVESFTNADFNADTNYAGVITKISVSVMRAGTDGIWETGAGSATGIVYNDVVSDMQTAYDNSSEPEITTSAGNAVNIREGAADTNKVFAIQNLSGTEIFSVSGGGGIILDIDEVHIGFLAGSNGQGGSAVAVGRYSGTTNQGGLAVSVGSNTGTTNQGAASVAVGDYAGWTDQGIYSVAIGKTAARYTQGTYSVALGFQAGQTTQSNYAIAIGSDSGNATQGAASVAIGQEAGKTSQGAAAVALGQYAGKTTQGGNSIAIGYNSGAVTQNSDSIAIGMSASYTGQGLRAVSIGREAGYSDQSNWGVSVGYQAGRTSQGSDAVAIGTQSGSDTQSNYAVAVGGQAGRVTQGLYGVSLGYQAGNDTQGSSAVAIGQEAGKTTQGSSAVAIGISAGKTTQGSSAVAIGNSAGSVTQSNTSVAIGSNAGFTGQGERAVAIGKSAGYLNQTFNCVHIGGESGVTSAADYCIGIGYRTGYTGQLTQSIAIGGNAGSTNQGSRSIAIGMYAGQNNFADDAIVIGYNAARNASGDNSLTIGRDAVASGGNAMAIGEDTTVSHANSIMINATGLALASAQASAFYVSPMRSVSTGNMLNYDTTTKEITYGSDVESKTQYQSATANITSFAGALDASGTLSYNQQIGEMYINASALTTITTTTTWTKVQFTSTTGGRLVDFTHTTPNRLVYTGTNTRYAVINVSFTIQPASNTDTNWNISIYKNGTVNGNDEYTAGTLLPGGRVGLHTITSTHDYSGNIQAIVQLATNDYVELAISNNTNVINCTCDHFNMNIFMLGA
jgi:hypothetical protein